MDVKLQTQYMEVSSSQVQAQATLPKPIVHRRLTGGSEENLSTPELKQIPAVRFTPQ